MVSSTPEPGSPNNQVRIVHKLPIPEVYIAAIPFEKLRGSSPEVLVQGPDAPFLREVAHADDFFSSVPKFVLGLVDMYRKHPNMPW